MRILISDKFSESGLAVFQGAANVEVAYRPGIKGEELLSAIVQADALIVRSETKVTTDLLAAAGKLKVIGRAGAGVDNIDLPAASRRGIVVMNTPGGNTVATAEHAIALMMSLARRIPQAHAALKAGKWEKSKNMGVELADKTLGVIGFGNVGRVVTDRALGFKMRVLVHDPFVVPDKIIAAGATPVEFDQLLAESDFITIHAVKNDKTVNMINAATIAKMKKGVRLINAARGVLVNEADLLAALQSGQIAGAAVDVYPVEPCTDSPLFALDNVVVTPHLGASTSEAQENVAVAIARQVLEYLQKGVALNAVNAPYVEPEMAKRMAPVLDLAERLGAVLGQVIEAAPHTLKIFFGGDFAAMPSEPLRRAILVQFLRHLHSEGEVNAINAPYFAEQHGIKIVETKRPQLTDYANVIGVKAVTAKGEHEIQGSIPAPNEPRIVQFNDYRITVEPEGWLLLMTNKDVPGVVGDVGMTLGRAKVNIGQLRLGRIKGQDHALMVVNIDSKAPDELVDALRRLPQVLSVKQVYAGDANQ